MKILSDKEIEKIHKELVIREPVWDSGKGCWTKGEYYQRAVAIAEAQLWDALRQMENLMALERCDPDVMSYFKDYYWIPKHIWQELKKQAKGR